MNEDAGNESAGLDDIPISIEGYELVRELSAGGQAVIFLAVQKSTGRKVAIKILLEGPLSSSVERTRMEREVRILASLDHPNIVSVVDRGETPEGWPYFVLEYVNGKVLAEYMDEFRDQHAPLGLPEDCAELLRLFTRVCDAVHAAHLRGIVHRDIKPSNIVIDPYGEPHILDFGVARPPLGWSTDKDHLDPDTLTGEFLGSLQWASPEQTEGDDSRIDLRADVYSLGVVLYEMLTGEFPYEVFGKIRDVLNNIATARPRPPSEVLDRKIAELARSKAARRLRNPVGQALDAIVLKALAKSPKDRYQTAGELSRDIGCYLAGKDVAAMVSRSRSHWVIPVALAGVAVVLGVGAALLFRGDQAEPPPVDAGPASVTPAYQLGENVFGYRIDGDRIVFEFNQLEYRTARMADGSLGNVGEVDPVNSVVVAGPFNEWDKDDPGWLMERVGRRRFELSKPIGLFRSRSEWPFKFVVNGTIWVSAPDTAANKVVVAEDTATYNLILQTPGLSEDRQTAELRQYRDQINAVWPGQGANLGVDLEGRFHFTMTHLPENVRIRNLKPLAGIPLTSLNLGEVRISDFSAVKSSDKLTTLICNDATYLMFVSEVVGAMERGDLDVAARHAEGLFAGFDAVPAFATFRRLVRDSVAAFASLKREPGVVPPEARAYKGHHYMLMLTPMTWDDAKNYAASQNGYLAVVGGEAEQEWLTSEFGIASLGRTLWLGGTDRESEGVWVWVNREPWAYENWTHPEPNNNNGVEHVLAMRWDGWWIDADGGGLGLPFIIEWDH